MELASAASQALGVPVSYELSVVNVDKPPLELAEVQRRVAQFHGAGTVVLTRAETFHKKGATFPGLQVRTGLGHRYPFDPTPILRRI